MKNFKTTALFFLIGILTLKNSYANDSIYNYSAALNKEIHSTPDYTVLQDNILSLPNTVSLRTQSHIEEAKVSFQVLEKNQRWVDRFSNQDLVELPVGVQHTIGNVEYSIGVTKAVFNTEYTELNIFARIRLPQNDASGKPIELFFGANTIKLSHQGGIIGEAKLMLLGDIYIPFNGNKWLLALNGGFDYTSGFSSDLTFVTIDCDGVKNMKITGSVEFSRDLILPVEQDGNVNPLKTTYSKTVINERGTYTIDYPNRVHGNFSTEVSDWNDITATISLQSFVLAKKSNGKDYNGNFQFYVDTAIFDFSDLRNDPAIVFPDYYHQHGLLLPNVDNWRGVYVRAFEIGLPKEFKTTDSTPGQPIRFGAHNLIIDSYGVSGTFFADNLFPLDKGITGNEKSWAYSLEHIDLTIAANTFVKANLAGRIVLPVSKQPEEAEETDKTRIGLAYTGFISAEEYSLRVITKTDINFNIWKANATLLPNSSIELKVKDNAFLPKANLHGYLSISANTNKNQEENTEKNLVEFKGITFQNLQLQTISPLVSVEGMGYKGEVKFANFPVSIADINLTAHNDRADLYFSLGLNLMESAGLGATTRIGILGTMQERNHKQKWKFDGLDIAAITINTKFSGFQMNGTLILMDDDPVYGDGFSGDLMVDVSGIVTVKAKAIFGKSTFRYWYFDAAAKWPAVPSPFMINGFGGGAYYKMRRNSEINIGEFSPSGLTYTPDEKQGLGLKALIYFHIGKEEICDGEAGFEIAFNSNGGINTLALFGKANIVSKLPGTKSMTGLMNKVSSNVTSLNSFMGVTEQNMSGSFAKKYLPIAEATIPGDLSEAVGIKVATAIEFDFQNNSMHGTLDVYINTPGNFLSGVGAGGRAGWAVFHKDPKDWYIYIGTLEDRCGIKLGIAGMYLKTTSYFMTGTQLPGSPPPPSVVAEILGVEAQQLNYMRDENALANAGGFAFGANLDLDTGDLSFLIFYARFQAGIGFDIMLKDYGETSCSNTGKQVGINGWYANGQSYAYLQGTLGVRIKLLFIRLKIPIISGGAAVLMQAKLPNPVWMRGYVGGHMNILGGLIKGRFRFKLTIGKECIFENASPLGGIKLITDVTPKDNTSDIDVFTAPQAVFSMKVNEPIIIPEDDADQTYKIILEKFTILDDGIAIPGTLEWNKMKDRATFVSTDILPPVKTLKVKVEVSFQKLENGIFKPMMVDGKLATETEERTFTTGTAPTYIPLHNIKYSYPVVEQKHFFTEEYDKGYIQLKQGQDYLFDDAQWKTNIKITEEGSNVKTAVFNYNTTTNEIVYTMPPNLGLDKAYTLNINSTLKTKNNVTTPIVTEQTTVYENKDGNDITILNQKAEYLTREGEIERLTYTFHSSAYRNFRSKMKRITTKNYNFGKIYSDVIYLSTTISDHEAHDLVELEGSAYSNTIPLLTAESTLEDDYFRLDINPYLYQNYVLNGAYGITNRDTDELGIPPAKALPINSYYLMSLENEVNQQWIRTNFPYKYNLPLLYKQDWVDMRNQIVNDYVQGRISGTHNAVSFLEKDFKFMRSGFYSVRIKYTLPGEKKVSEFIYRFKNPNNFR